MRSKLGMAVCVACLLACPSAASAEEERGVIRRFADRLRPLPERIRDDDRVRTTGRVVGLGVAAYGLFHDRPQAPVTFVGTQALRLGLRRELAGIRARSGFTVEPSLGRRGFAVTLRRTID